MFLILFVIVPSCLVRLVALFFSVHVSVKADEFVGLSLDFLILTIVVCLELI